MKKKRKQHGRFSMKWSLIAIICICWILPIVVILLVSSNMITGNLETQIVKMVDGSAEYAVDLTQSRVENVFAASRKPSYDPKFREMYLRYKEDGDIISYYSDMSDYIAIQYRYDEHFYTTMVYLTDEPENLYFVLNNDITGAAFKVLNYKEHIHAEVQEIAKSMGTEIRLHETEYGLFLVRNIMDSSYRPYAVIVQELNTDKILQNMGTIPW
ncbi:hypothetical protein LJC07_07995, partial [Christensenellaceae bacterium OttesenSCG-928-L17]|nr:hypothetical protein [Christensenellaceae bacterium OttesenSCG-928-L17]